MEQRKDELDGAIERDRLTLKEEIAAALAELQKPISAEEIERRRRLAARIFKIREEIGPIDISISDMVRERPSYVVDATVSRRFSVTANPDDPLPEPHPPWCRVRYPLPVHVLRCSLSGAGRNSRAALYPR